MKKIYCFIIAVIFVFTLCGCNETQKEQLRFALCQSVYPQEKYTTQSYDSYRQAYSHAEKILNTDFATKKVILNAQKILEDAVNNLKVATKGVYKIDYKFILKSNNSVGNDWVKVVYCNGQDITDLNIVTVPFDSVADIRCTVTEKDKIPDEANAWAEIYLKDGENGSVFVSVKETNGRYKGNVAIWELKYSVALTERI